MAAAAGTSGVTFCLRLNLIGCQTADNPSRTPPSVRGSMQRAKISRFGEAKPNVAGVETL